MTFRTWLKKWRTTLDDDDHYEGYYDCPIVDLANDAFDSPEWKGRTPQSLLIVMRNRGACDLAEQALLEAMPKWSLECASSQG